VEAYLAESCRGTEAEGLQRLIDGEDRQAGRPRDHRTFAKRKAWISLSCDPWPVRNHAMGSGKCTLKVLTPAETPIPPSCQGIQDDVVSMGISCRTLRRL